MVTIVPIETPTLGDRSYLAHDGQVGLVVDPQRDIDRVLQVAEAAGVRITHVFETHIHNDYVTGGDGPGEGNRRGIPRQRGR
jgi:hydroxyacylglutathione hydrolase